MVKSIINKHTSMRDFINCICTEIKFAQREYKIAFHRKIRHLQVLIDYSAFTSLKKKITYLAIATISHKLNSTKINIKKFNQQIFFEVESGHTAIIGPPGDYCFSKCKLSMRFSLSCKFWLYQCVID